MECYYNSFDVKVGDLVISRREAESLGLTETSDSVFGKLAKVVKDGVAVASGRLTRVLRGICFSGCGIVKNPANPASVILETANVKDDVKEDIVLNYDKIDTNVEEKQTNNLTSDKVDESISEVIENKENSEDVTSDILSYAKFRSSTSGDIKKYPKAYKD
jgi:hypothetical protein